jgi:type III secretion protein V
MEHSTALIDLQDLDGWLEEQRAIHPMLVKRTLEHVHPREILIVIRGFLRDRIPLPPIRAVLTTLAENPVFGDTAERPRFVERARLHLAAYWVRDVVDALERLGPPCWVRLLPDAEAELCDRSSTAEYSIRLTISDEERERWIAALREVIPDDDRRHPLVVVATPEARPVLAELVRRATPHIPVLSLAELEVASLRVESAWVCAPQ